jgi:hypothetical protein
MGTTSDRDDPRLTHGADNAPVPMADVYLVLSDKERAKGFVRPVRRTYVHQYMLDGSDLPRVLTTLTGVGGCGAATTMGQAIAETYAREPNFYGSTYCVGCGMHRPVGASGEFTWDDGSKVGT